MLKYSEIRRELIDHLEDLARRSRLFEDPLRGSVLDYAVHFLFDDMRLDEDSSSAVGVFLHDPVEAHLISDLVAALDAVFQRHGTTQTDRFYASCNAWERVELAASKALTTMTNNDRCPARRRS